MNFRHSYASVRAAVIGIAIVCSKLLFLSAGPVLADGDDNSRISSPDSAFGSVQMAWSDARPLYFSDDAGAATGLAVELAYELGREVGFDIKPYRIPDFATWGRDQNSGDSEILPMAAKLPALVENNLFSDVVFTSEVRFAVRIEDSDTFDYNNIAGVRIGVLTPGAGSDPALYPSAVMLSFSNTRAALISLLSGEIDAIATESGFTFAEAQAARLDHRIAFVGPPIEVAERVVVVHKSRAELLDPINDAIAKMKANGRIDALVRRFRARVPSVAPEVLQIPVAHMPPWMKLENNTVTGFSVELIEELADRSGLAIEFVPVSLKDYFESVNVATADLLPVIQTTNKISEFLDLTLPIQLLPLNLFVRDADSQLHKLADLSNLRVGGFPDTVLLAQENELPAAEIIAIDDAKTLVSALETGEIDAILEVAGGLKEALPTEQFHSIGSPEFEAAIAIGLRAGLGVVRERLNVVFPSFLLTNKYAALKEKYFGEPVFWTPQRITVLLIALGAAFTLLMVSFIWQRQRQQQLMFARQKQDLEREKAYAVELGELVKNLELTNREQAEFTYAVSHDLKSPSNTIGMLISELDEEGSLGENGQQVLSDMKVTNSRMGQTVKDVLDYSRVIHNELQVETVDCNEMIDMIIKDLKADVLEADAEITRTQLPTLQGHTMQLRILFQNLISNAIKFRSPDRSPVIEITADSLPLGTRITVSDNGIGIPSEHRERVFGMFFRLYVHSEYEGTGLGLAICRRVVLNHGGDISAKAGPDGGTRIEITFGKERNV
ncbi:MAG: transporter substrate-binding domain-containing protein [Granulosicoccus sp.]